METDLVVALIAGGVSISTALFTASNAMRQSRLRATTDAELERLRHELERALRREDRHFEAKVVLDRYRRPLLSAAVQLLRRIENIRSRSFLAYLQAGDGRAQTALRSTLYRFAAYLGWRALLDRELTYLHFEDTDQTRDVLALLDAIRAALASSQLDSSDGAARMMLWSEEQAAIGGLMLRTDGSPGVLGFECFDERYAEWFEVWFDEFADDLAEGGAGMERLAATATALRALIERLDVEGIYGSTPEHVKYWSPSAPRDPT